jgi:hypothetical protein
MPSAATAFLRSPTLRKQELVVLVVHEVGLDRPSLRWGDGVTAARSLNPLLADAGTLLP